MARNLLKRDAMLARWTLPCALLAVASCGPLEESGDPLRSQSQEIIGGVIDNGDPAVVAFAANGGWFCSGTLIGKQTVITAAHCINARGPNAQYSVLFGTQANAPVRSVAVTQQFADPQFQDPNDNRTGHDVGILRLAAPVTDVKPIPINTTPLTQGDVGKMIRHVGFGVTNGAQQTGGGTKREVTLPIRLVVANELEAGAQGKQTCNGDSGGPGFVVTAGNTLERVVGITSYGDQTCVQVGFDSRVDAALGFIMNTAAAWEKLGTCSTDTVCIEGCVPVDADCACAEDGQCSASCATPASDPDCVKECASNGVCAPVACATPDPDCVAVGGACTTANQCVGRQCVSDAQRATQYCSQTCSAQAPCPGGMECSTGVCRFVQLPEVDLGQACSAQSFCKGGGVCSSVLGPLACQAPCSALGACGTGQTCVTGTNGLRFCGTASPGQEVPNPSNPGSPSNPTPSTINNTERNVIVGTCSQAGGAMWLWALLAMGPWLIGSRRRALRG